MSTLANVFRAGAAALPNINSRHNGVVAPSPLSNLRWVRQNRNLPRAFIFGLMPLPACVSRFSPVYPKYFELLFIRKTDLTLQNIAA